MHAPKKKKWSSFFLNCIEKKRTSLSLPLMRHFKVVPFQCTLHTVREEIHCTVKQDNLLHNAFLRYMHLIEARGLKPENTTFFLCVDNALGGFPVFPTSSPPTKKKSAASLLKSTNLQKDIIATLLPRNCFPVRRSQPHFFIRCVSRKKLVYSEIRYLVRRRPCCFAFSVARRRSLLFSGAILFFFFAGHHSLDGLCGSH